MFLIEPNIHVSSRTTDDYEKMYDAGIRVVVEPSHWLGSPRRYAGSFFDNFRQILEFETARAAQYGIDHFACLGINATEAQNRRLVDEVLAGMGEYLSHHKCVGIGEIGLRKITENEIYAFRRQLMLAEEMSLPVMVCLPDENSEIAAYAVHDIITAEGFNQNSILIDNNTEDSLSILKSTDCFFGLTINRYSKMEPGRVGEILKKFGSDRIMLSSSADWAASDPLSLPTTLDYLSAHGFPVDVLRLLCRHNTEKFFSRNVRWKPKYDILPKLETDLISDGAL